MKIINKPDFLKLPIGTVYSDYGPFNITNFAIKGESLIESNDFYYTSIIDSIDSETSSDFFDILEKAEKEKTSFNIDLDVCSREGFFEKNQLFVIWEKSDIEKLIKKLSECLEVQTT